MNLKVNKPIEIPSIIGATLPDGFSRPYELQLNLDGTYTVVLYFYATEQDLLDNIRVVRVEKFSMALGGVLNQIIARAKLQPSLDQATNLP